MTIWHHKHNVLFIVICFCHASVPLQTRDLCSWHCKNSLEMCLERLRWVSGYILALIAKEHTTKPLNNIFTDVQQDARGQNWSLLKNACCHCTVVKNVSIHHAHSWPAGRALVPPSLPVFHKGSAQRAQPCFLLTPEQQGGGKLWERESSLGQRGRKACIATLNRAEQNRKICPGREARSDNPIHKLSLDLKPISFTITPIEKLFLELPSSQN